MSKLCYLKITSPSAQHHQPRQYRSCLGEDTKLIRQILIKITSIIFNRLVFQSIIFIIDNWILASWLIKKMEKDYGKGFLKNVSEDMLDSKNFIVYCNSTVQIQKNSKLFQFWGQLLSCMKGDTNIWFLVLPKKK